MLPLSLKFYLVLALGAVAIPLGLFVSLLCLYCSYQVVFQRRPVVCWSFNGYTVFGVADPAFRESFHAMLSALGYAWEHTESGVHLPTHGIHITISVSSKGIATLETDKASRVFLKGIMDRLRDYYATASVPMTPQYTIIGTVMTLVGTVFVVVALSNMMITEKKLSYDIAAYSERECTKQMTEFAAKRGIDANAFITTNHAFLSNCQLHIEQLLHQREKH